MEDILTFFVSYLTSFENFEDICLRIHIAILARSFDRISQEICKWNKKKKNKEKGKTMKKSRKNKRKMETNNNTKKKDARDFETK